MLKLGEKAGYEIHGYDNKISEHEKVLKAQVLTWGVKKEQLKEGDLVWIRSWDQYIGQNDPAKVLMTTRGPLIEDTRRINDTYWTDLSSYDIILRAPEDFYDNQLKYADYDYWLDIAEDLELEGKL